MTADALERRHRLVVPKYNPARTFTPEGAVGLGGTYLCIYPMDSPGGAQAPAQLQHLPAAVSHSKHVNHQHWRSN